MIKKVLLGVLIVLLMQEAIVAIIAIPMSSSHGHSWITCFIEGTITISLITSVIGIILLGVVLLGKLIE